MAKRSYGKNVEIDVQKDKYVITIKKVDAKAEPYGRSKSGKTITIGTTGGNVKLDDDTVIGINHYTYPEE